MHNHVGKHYKKMKKGTLILLILISFKSYSQSFNERENKTH